MTTPFMILEPRSMRQLDWELDAEHAARTIGGQQDVARVIWGRRNFRGSNARSMLEMITIWYGSLSESARSAPRAAYSTPFAMVGLGTTIVCLANQIAVDLGEAMAVKYPGACFYCHQTGPCTCDGESKKARQKQWGSARPDLMVLSIVEWQGKLRTMYGDGNRTRGIDFVMRRFAEEHAELLRAVRMKESMPIEEEIADVFAWWIGLANILELDAGKLLMNPLRRPDLSDGCYSCALTPCMNGPNCPIF